MSAVTKMMRSMMPLSELSVVDGPGTRPLAARDRALPPRGDLSIVG